AVVAVGRAMPRAGKRAARCTVLNVRWWHRIAQAGYGAWRPPRGQWLLLSCPATLGQAVIDTPQNQDSS
ncbi:MAG: hypothetical protein ING25_00075, partial [Burkholderiales bacterium]|nr:hypothetical protein [Burkholderiales bacterium]